MAATPRTVQTSYRSGQFRRRLAGADGKHVSEGQQKVKCNETDSNLGISGESEKI